MSEYIRKQFQEKKYAFLDDFVDPDDAKNLAREIQMYSLVLGSDADSMVTKSPSLRDLACTDRLLEFLTPYIEEYTGLNLLPTYAYSRVYVPGETLKAHTDRPACEISVTLTLDVEGEPWDIFVGNHANEADAEKILDGYKDSKWPVKNIVGFRMNPGQGVLYRGEEIVHWRDEYEAPEGSRQTQVFLHYVDANGPNADHVYDKRPGLEHTHPKSKNLNSFYPLYLNFESLDSIDKFLDNMQLIHEKLIEAGNMVNKVTYEYDISGFSSAHLISVKSNDWITPSSTIKDNEQKKLTAIMFTEDCDFYHSSSISQPYPMKRGAVVILPSFLKYKIVHKDRDVTAVVEMFLNGPPFR